MDPKDVAARRAVEFVRDGMTLGLGTGSTSAFMIQALGERVKSEGLQVRGVPTSELSKALALSLGIPVLDLNEAGTLDLALDGADEAGPNMNLIKGGGGALLQEKLVVAAAKEFIVICDSSKLKKTLGKFPLPVAIIPFGWKTTEARLKSFCPDIFLRLAKDGSGSPFITDDGLYILDLHLGVIANPPELERTLKMIVGVAEVGLFCGMAKRIVVGYADGRSEVLE